MPADLDHDCDHAGDLLYSLQFTIHVSSFLLFSCWPRVGCREWQGKVVGGSWQLLVQGTHGLHYGQCVFLTGHASFGD